MDAGVPIKRPVAGVAMGLIKDVENTGKVAVLTDIQDVYKRQGPGRASRRQAGRERGQGNRRTRQGKGEDERGEQAGPGEQKKGC